MVTRMEILTASESESSTREGSTTSSSESSVGTLNFAPISNIDNGSFETGDFQYWSTIGDTSIIGDTSTETMEDGDTSIETMENGDTSTETMENGDASTENSLGIFPTDGTYLALISSGDSDAGGSVVDSDLEEFLDLAPGSLDGLTGGDAFEGSAIKQTFTAEAGDIVSFDWNFLTNENTPATTFNDTAFFNVDGFTFELADTGSTFVDAADVDEFNEQTGNQTLTFAISTAGTYTIGFGVVDVGDAIVDSALAIDNVATASSGISAFSSTSSAPSVDLILGEEGFEMPDGTSMNGSEPMLTLTDSGFTTM